MPRIAQIRMAPPRTKVGGRVSVTAVAFAELCLALTEGEFSRVELIKRTGIHDATLGKWLRYLKQRRLIHICAWSRTHRTGAVAAVWTWGYLKHDAAKPAPKTQREYTATHEANKHLGVFYDFARPTKGSGILP